MPVAVICSLLNVVIPGLGTFSCRVLIYNDKYAGTWTHGAAGGHMFGVLQSLKPQDSAKDAAKQP